MLNKYQAHWLSHSSISTFKNCPLAYYYSAVFKDDEKCKISTVSPYMTLGLAVHSPLESLAEVPSEERKNKKFAPEFFKVWESMSGEKGGFENENQENEFKERGIAMLKNVKSNIQYLEGETAFLLPDHSELPWMWLSEEENLILSGKLDYILKKENEYFVIDFKTGLKEEKADSLQLPIYRILLNHFLPGGDFRAAYWQLQTAAAPVEKQIPSLAESRELVLDIGRKIKQARLDKNFECPRGDSGCFACQGYQKIINGSATYIARGIYGAKMYKVNK